MHSPDERMMLIIQWDIEYHSTSKTHNIPQSSWSTNSCLQKISITAETFKMFVAKSGQLPF
jgi:hypothetical protein